MAPGDQLKLKKIDWSNENIKMTWISNFLLLYSKLNNTHQNLPELLNIASLLVIAVMAHACCFDLVMGLILIVLLF